MKLEPLPVLAHGVHLSAHLDCGRLPAEKGKRANEASKNKASTVTLSYGTGRSPSSQSGFSPK
jgi:hypothetical protein